MSLSALPPEIISCIVANASPPTLCNLARCSRKLHLCTISHLYRHVKIRNNEQLITLASLLTRRPDLAGLVRHFTFYGAVPSRRRAQRSEDGIRPRLFKVDRTFANPANASSLSKEEKIKCLGQFRPTHKSYYDLILALLLPALLKVERLELDWDIRYDTYYLEQMMGRAARREKPFDAQPPFEALRVFVMSHKKLHVRSTGFIASLLKLPAIEEISGGVEKHWSDDDDDDLYGDIIPSDKNLEDMDSSSSPLTSLDLAAYTLSRADLCHILRAPKALKTLFFKVCEPTTVNFTDLRHALVPQENCLESLDLDCDPDCEMKIEVFGSMTSFISFNTLKVFKAAALFFLVMITGSESHGLINIFPPSLETLHLTRFHACFGNLLEALGILLARKSEHQIPSFKKLILDEADSFDPPWARSLCKRRVKLMDVWWRGTQDTAIGRLDEVAAAQGVSIEIEESQRVALRRVGNR